MVVASVKPNVKAVEAWVQAISKVLLILKRIPNAACQDLYQKHKVDAMLMAGGEDSISVEGRKTR